MTQKKIDLKTKKGVIIPTEDVMINQSFIELVDEDLWVVIKPNMTSVTKYFEKGGQPVINPENGKPMFGFNAGMSMQIITREEYQSMLEAIKRKLMR